MYNYCIIKAMSNSLKEIYMCDAVCSTQRPGSPSFAIFNIWNFRLRTLIGFIPDENVKKQNAVLNINNYLEKAA